jgi:CRISPR-associated protein Cas1
MSAEGHVRDAYYEAIDQLLPEEYKIIKRERRPPPNKGNCLVSFANGMLYSTILSEIYHTHLNPTVSFLHEPSERRFSLALDIAEIFKPIIADRVVLTLVRKKMLSEKDFETVVAGLSLSERGKKIFLTQFNEKLESTIKHKGLGRNVSYRHLIRLELYKLEKHLLGIKPYRPLKVWW